MKNRLACFATALLWAVLCAPLAAETLDSEVEAAVDGGPLRGTLTLPAEPRDVVVIVPGSGPTNRDGDSPAGVEAGYLKMLAQELAAAQVASIRVDKRGMFGSIGSFGDANAVTFDDYAGDARAWIDVARERAGTDCAWLLGHSEGGLVALVAAQTAGDELCGLILVAAPGRRMGDVLRAQLRANPANQPLLNDAFAAIGTLEHGERVDVTRLHPALQQLFAPAVQGFLIDAFARDPATLIASVGKPVLIVQGDADIQVTVEDARLLARAQPAAELVVIPGMNHVLKTPDGNDFAANIASYADPERPLTDGISDAIADFLTARR